MAYYRHRRDPRNGIIGLAGCVAFIIIIAFYFMVIGVETTADVLGVLLGKGAIYDEEVLADYADQQYAEVFADSPATEDNLMIIILVDPDCEEYHYYARVGEHIGHNVANLYAHDDSKFSRVVESCIERGAYGNTLSQDLVYVLSRMNATTDSVPDDQRFTCEEPHYTNDLLINRSHLELREGVINRQLNKTTFTTVLLVEDMRDVYGYHVPLKELLIAITALLAAAGIVLLIVYLIRKPPTKREKLPEGGRRQEGTDYIEQLDDDHWEQRYEQDFSE